MLDELIRDSSAGPSLENLFESFLGIDRLDTKALLQALLPMVNDVALAAEVHAELSRRAGRGRGGAQFTQRKPDS